MGSRAPAFDDAVSSWSTYRVRLEAYFEGNEITDAAKRRALLVSSLSDSVVRILQGHQPGVPINSLTRSYTPRSGTFAVDGTECDSEEEMMYALVAHSSANKHLVQPIERTLTWEGRRLRMIVDTGSPRRHVDQVRPRDSSTPLKKKPCETPIAMEHSSPEIPLSSSGIQSTSSEAVQAGLATPGEEASGGVIEPASPRSTAEPILLRPSTRARKPPNRF
ncbi:hypothetical protein MTO96_017134 [Rhipicephalus appendiculatus]